MSTAEQVGMPECLQLEAGMVGEQVIRLAHFAVGSAAHGPLRYATAIAACSRQTGLLPPSDDRTILFTETASNLAVFEKVDDEVHKYVFARGDKGYESVLFHSWDQRQRRISFEPGTTVYFGHRASAPDGYTRLGQYQDLLMRYRQVQTLVDSEKAKSARRTGVWSRLMDQIALLRH